MLIFDRNASLMAMAAITNPIEAARDMTLFELRRLAKFEREPQINLLTWCDENLEARRMIRHIGVYRGFNRWSITPFGLVVLKTARSIWAARRMQREAAA